MPRPLLPILLHVAAASVSTFLPGTAEPATGDSVRLLEWINGSEGGFVHPTHSVRRLGPGFRGIFARQAVAEGATLAIVPWRLCVTVRLGDSAADGHCGLSKRALEALVGGDTPYARMLREYDPQLPSDWSPNARRALDGLPPGDWDRHLRWFEGSCLKRTASAEERRGMYLMVARSGSSRSDRRGHLFLAPLYDLYNHRNGRFHNTLVKVVEEESIQIIAKRDIAAGEELFNTYGEGTLELFRDYGFLEPRPRVWDLVSDVRFVEDEAGRVTWPAHGPPRGRARDDFLGRLSTLKRALHAPLPEAAAASEEKLLAKAASFVAAVAAAVDAAAADLENNQLTDEL